MCVGEWVGVEGAGFLLRPFALEGGLKYHPLPNLNIRVRIKIRAKFTVRIKVKGSVRVKVTVVFRVRVRFPLSVTVEGDEWRFPPE